MKSKNNTPRFLILTMAISTAVMANAGLAGAVVEDGASPSRMEMIMKKLMPDTKSTRSNNAGRIANDHLSKRLVMSANGIGQQNVLINSKHSLDLSVLFEAKNTVLTDKAQSLLTDLGEALQAKRLRNSTYLIGGHTDATGDAKQNRKLSAQRAASVKTYLVNNFGIDPARLAIAGYGDQRLADKDNPTAKVNRRIEVSLISTGYTVKKKRLANSIKKRLIVARAETINTIPPAQMAKSYDHSPQYRITQRRPDMDQLRPMPVGYQMNRQFDDYNSDIFTPPTIEGRYGSAQTCNTVCDSYEGVLTDPRPQHMELDDYDARTPAICPTASQYEGSYTSGGYDQPYDNYSSEDDIELLK